jgi:hypothetical protein
MDLPLLPFNGVVVTDMSNSSVDAVVDNDPVSAKMIRSKTMSVEYSVTEQLKVIYGLTVEATSSFYSCDGSQIR